MYSSVISFRFDKLYHLYIFHTHKYSKNLRVVLNLIAVAIFIQPFTFNNLEVSLGWIVWPFFGPAVKTTFALQMQHDIAFIILCKS